MYDRMFSAPWHLQKVDIFPDRVFVVLLEK